ncbi:MAG: hypothetical protein ACI4EU_03175 [Butyrivibrio sp.]
MSKHRFTEYLNEHGKFQIFISLLPAVIVCVYMYFYDVGLFNKLQEIRYNNIIIADSIKNNTLRAATKSSDGNSVMVSGEWLKTMYIGKGDYICSVLCNDKNSARFVFDDLTSFNVIRPEILGNPDYGFGYSRYRYTINNKEYLFNSGEKMFDIYLDSDNGFQIVMGLDSFYVDSICGMNITSQNDGKVKLTIDSSFRLDYDEKRMGDMFYCTNLPTDEIYVNTDALMIYRPMPKNFVYRFILMTGMPVFAAVSLVWGLAQIKLRKIGELEFMGGKDALLCVFGAVAVLIALAVESVVFFNTI